MAESKRNFDIQLFEAVKQKPILWETTARLSSKVTESASVMLRSHCAFGSTV